MHQKAMLITYYKLCQGIRNESRINFRRQLRERMLQLRQQRRQAAELRNNPAAAAEGSAPLLSDESPAGSSASNGNSGGNPGNFYAEEEEAANRQRLNIVGPPERSPTLEGGPAYEDPRPLSRSVATSTAELPADNGLYHVSEPLRTVWFRPGAAGNQEGSSSSSSSTSNLQLRRISRLNSAPGGGVTLATNIGGGSRGPRIGLESGGGAVASGIFEESVQRVTLAVGEGEAAPPPPPPLPHQQQEQEEEQEMVEEERIVEDIVREMMRNEGSVRQRWVTYSGVGTLPVMVR
jgi:hypothetical protein